MNDFQLTHLSEKAARNLAGRPVVLRFRQPALAGAKATAFRLHGLPVIDVTPGLGEKDFLHCLCHETGHIVDLWSGWTDQTDHPSGSLHYYPYIRNHPTVTRIESNADSMATQWLAYADSHAAKYPGDWLESRLRALAAYTDPELQAKVSRWTQEAAVKAVNEILARNNVKR